MSFNVCIGIVVPGLRSQSDGCKFIKGNSQRAPLDITKFTERWKPTGDEDSRHSIISSLHFYWFASQEGGGLTYPPGVCVVFFQTSTIYSQSRCGERIRRPPFLPWSKLRLDQECFLLDWCYEQAPSHQMTGSNHFQKIAFLRSIKQQMSHEGLKLHFNLFSTTRWS